MSAHLLVQLRLLHNLIQIILRQCFEVKCDKKHWSGGPSSNGWLVGWLSHVTYVVKDRGSSVC